MKKKQTIRMVTLISILVVIFGVFGARLFSLQVIHGEEYSLAVDNTATGRVAIKAARGEILDRNGVAIAANRMGLNVVFNAFYTAVDERNNMDNQKLNESILWLCNTLKSYDKEWTDNLPITKTEPFSFTEGKENEIESLKKNLGLNVYADCGNVLDKLKKDYQIENLSGEELRAVAGVRYEMTTKLFSVNNPYTFASDVGEEAAALINEQLYRLSGVNVEETAIRYYPEKDLASHIIGLIGPIYAEDRDKYLDMGYQLNALVGTSGIELLYEEELRGIDGEMQVTKNKKGEIISEVVTKEPVPGKNVILTIDARLQREAQNLIKQRIEELNAGAVNNPTMGTDAIAGSTVAIEPGTGEILVIANYPSYDLNTFSKDYDTLKEDPKNPIQDRALLGQYRPGSIFKPVVATAALQKGTITPTSTEFCGGVLDYRGTKFTCLGTHGNINVVSALRHSCNIFFYQTGKNVGIDEIVKTANGFGLGVDTGIELGAFRGVIDNPEYQESKNGVWYPGDVLQASIGQAETAISPLSMATYASTLAMGGKRYASHLVKEIVDYHTGEATKTIEARLMSDMELSQTTIQTVTQGMLQASAQSGSFVGYSKSIATKTGTPEVFYNGQKAYDSTFIGFGPVEQPKMAVSVVIEKGGYGYLSGEVAKRLFDLYFELYGG